MLYALLVGVQEFQHPGIPSLMGPVSDVYAVEDLLRKAFPEQVSSSSIRRLLNQNVTRSKFWAAFDHLRQAGPEDQILFYFSGHGSRAPTAPELERFTDGGLDETLILHDSRAYAHEIHDKELAAVFAELAAQCPHLTVWMDCCHSGSMFRSSLRFRSLRNHDEPIALADLYGNWDATHPTVPAAPVTVLSACNKWEQAAEDPIQHRGAFTLALEQALSEAPAISYTELHRRSRISILNYNPAQTPQLECQEGCNPHRQLFGTATLGQAATFEVGYEAESAHQKAGWYLQTGILQGLPPDPKAIGRVELWRGNERVGETQLEGVGIEKSRLEWTGDTDEGKMLRASLPDYRPLPALVRVVGPEAEATNAVEEWQEKGNPFVELYLDAAPAAIELHFRDGNGRLYDALRRRFLFSESIPWPDQLTIWHRYQVLLHAPTSILTDSRGQLKVRWLTGPFPTFDQPNARSMVLPFAPDQTHFPVRLDLSSESDGRWYWYLLYLDHNPGVHLLAGDSWEGSPDWFNLFEGQLTLDAVAPGGQESLRLLVSHQPVDIFNVLDPAQPVRDFRSGPSEVLPLPAWTFPDFQVFTTRRHPLAGTSVDLAEGLKLESGQALGGTYAWRTSLPYTASVDQAETPARILREQGIEPLAFLTGEHWHFQVLELAGTGEWKGIQLNFGDEEGELAALIWEGEEIRLEKEMVSGEGNAILKLGDLSPALGRDSVTISFFKLQGNPLDFV